MSLDGDPEHRPARNAPGPGEGADDGREMRLHRKKRRLEAKNLANGGPGKSGRPKSTALAPIPAGPQLPARPGPAERARRRKEGLERQAKVEKDLARRRRGRVADLFFRLFGLVLLPTFLVGLYYYKYATDLYLSESAFVVKTASAPAPLGEGLLTGLSATPIATLQGSISVQDFILSREVLGRLERDLGIVAHFQDKAIDPVRRLAPDATMEDVYDYYANVVSVSYDPAESVIRMEVVAASPEMAQAISAALISYSEDMVDGLSSRLREDTLREAAEAVALAKTALEDAHLRVATLQQELMVFSTEVELGGETGIIHTLELEVEALRGKLDELLTYAAEDDARVVDLRRDIAFKRSQTAERRRNLVGDGSGAGGSLSSVNVELQRAEVEVMTQQQQFMSAMASQEAARIEAQRQVRYLAPIVPPALADKSTRPHRARNTALAFVIFFGIFMMVSLTISVLREQISV
jgi:capsular polysaccharide transport system permease protein